MAQESLDSQPSNMYKATVEETGEQLVIPTSKIGNALHQNSFSEPTFWDFLGCAGRP